MTAEIAILNKEAVALAADSAVTSHLGRVEKVSTSANKIFALSPHHPVGMMIYGSATFMDVPWETVIKEYRKSTLPEAGFDSLEEYGNDFISFLGYNNIKFPELAERLYISRVSNILFSRIRKEVFERCRWIVREETNADNEEDVDFDEFMTRAIEEIIAQYENKYRGREALLPLNHTREIMRRYRNDIGEAIQQEFSGIQIDRRIVRRLRRILLNAFTRSFVDNAYTGIVIAGFGNKDFLPAIRAYKVEGIIRCGSEENPTELLKSMHDYVCEIGVHSLSAVVAFAQREMVNRFMDGVDPDITRAERRFLDGICTSFVQRIVSQLDRYNDTERSTLLEQLINHKDQIIREFFGEMKAFRKQYFSDPIMNAVERLSKSELAAMAEALVHLTSLKRKVSQDAETVAEPIDVAVISKGDGFIWIKHKHYFASELNPQFFIKKEKEFIR